MSDYIKRLEAALRAYERVVFTREVTGSTEADRRFSEGEIYLSAREAMFDELAELEPQDLRSLLSDVERMRGALEEATSDRSLHYLRLAYRRLETIAEAIPEEKGLSLGNLALADERDWLDCHIDWLERTARQALSAPNAEEGE